MTSGSKYVIDIAVLCDSGKVKSAMKCPCPSCIFSDLLAYGAGGGCYRNTDGWLAASWLVIQCERAELARHVRDADQANAPCVSKVPTALPCADSEPPAATTIRRRAPGRWSTVQRSACTNGRINERYTTILTLIGQVAPVQWLYVERVAQHRACLALPPSLFISVKLYKAYNNNSWILSNL